MAPQTASSAPSQKGKNPGPACPSVHLAPTLAACTITATAKATTATPIRICPVRMSEGLPLVLQQVALAHQLLVHGLGLLQPGDEFGPGHEVRLEGVVADVLLPVGRRGHLLHQADVVVLDLL